MSQRNCLKIINKKLQLFSVLKLILFVFVFFVILVSAVLMTNYYNTKKLHSILTNVNITLIDQKQVASSIDSLNNIDNKKDLQVATTILQNNINNNIVQLDTSVKNINEINNYNQALMIILIFILLIQFIFLYIYLVYQSQSIAGPIHVFSKYLKELIAGKIPEVRPLRKHDQFQDLHLLFEEYVKKQKN